MFVYNRHKIDSLFGFLFTFFFRSVLKSYVLNTSSCMCIIICLDSFHNYCPTYVFCIGMTRTVFVSEEYLVLTLTARIWLNNFTSSDNRGNWLVSLLVYVPFCSQSRSLALNIFCSLSLDVFVSLECFFRGFLRIIFHYWGFVAMLASLRFSPILQFADLLFLGSYFLYSPAPSNTSVAPFFGRLDPLDASRPHRKIDFDVFLHRLCNFW